jgi:hypothetical protein
MNHAQRACSLAGRVLIWTLALSSSSALAQDAATEAATEENEFHASASAGAAATPSASAEQSDAFAPSPSATANTAHANAPARDAEPTASNDPRVPRTTRSEEDEEHDEPSIDLSATLGFGFMRGGNGGLTAGQRAPLCIDAQALVVKDDTWLLGGALRVELEDAKAIAGIARVALRHHSGALELRPGAGLPFYLAPRTMLGPEVSLGFRYAISDIAGLQGMAAISAYLFGSDVPSGSTVIMMHVFLGIGFLL